MMTVVYPSLIRFSLGAGEYVRDFSVSQSLLEEDCFEDSTDGEFAFSTV